MDWSSACYYTFSTICQTLAGAFGFLVAVVLYKSTQNHQWLSSGLQGATQGYKFAQPDDFFQARNEGNWSLIADMMRTENFDPGYQGDQQARAKANADREKWIAVADSHRYIMDDLRKALMVTGVVIVISLISLALTPLIIRASLAIFAALAIEVLGAICCLTMYYDLARAATN